MKEHEKAKAWRTRRKLTIPQLAELTGYGPRNIAWLEKGLTAPNGQTGAKPAAPWIWLRWKNMCAGIETQLRSGKTFDW